VRVDANDLGTTPVRFRMRTRALQVLAPEPQRGQGAPITG
jgi:hypothetical protein